MELNWQPHVDRAEQVEERRESVSLAEVLCHLTHCGIVAVDGERNVLAFNPEAECLTGVKAAEAVSLDALPTALRGLLSESLLEGVPVHHSPIRVPAASGNELTLNVTLSPFRGANGNVKGVIAVLSDLSSTAMLNQNMRRLDQLASIGTLSASMAHEIKNALVGIKTFVELLLKQNKDAELAEIVVRELRRVDSIVSQMLRFAGPAKPTFGAIHLHEVLDRALALVQMQLEGRKIRLSKSYEASPAWARGDTYQLEQALLNLFLNALEAMGPNGQLHVATDFCAANSSANAPAPARESSMLRVRIQDTGVGVLPENRERLFEPFFTTKPNGTGLGLSITRRIIQEHHGSISFESEPNRGTTFSILLPASAVGQ